MARQGISTGTVPNDGTGDTLLDGAVKINDNFVEVYDIIGDGTNTYVGIVTQITAGTNVSISTAYGSVEINASGMTTANIKSDTIQAGVATITTLEVTSFTGSGNAAGGTDDTFLNYTGTTKTAGSLYGGTDAPTNTNRLNFDGNLHATNLYGNHYGDGSNLNNLDAADLTSGTVPDARFPATLPASSGVELTGIVTSITAGSNITISGSTGNVTINATGGGGGSGSGIDVGYGLTAGSSIGIVGTGITQVDFIGVGYTVEVSGSTATVRNLAQGLEVIEVTSIGYAATIFAGSQMSYSATSNNANARWFIEDYDGLTSIAIGYDTGTMGGGQLDGSGTYNIGIRAGTYFGLSERHNISLTIEPFTLTMDTAFGDETSLLMWDSDGNGYGMLATGGLVDYDGVNYVIDRDNSNIGSATSHAIFYSPSANRLIGFRYDSSENVDSYRYWTSVSNASDGTDVGSGNILDLDSGNLADQILPENMLRATVGGGGTGGYWFPTGDRQNFLGGSHYLEITPSDSTLDSFGTKSNGSWSYGFTLEDPWIVSGGIQQMLAPSTSATGWHLFGVHSYTIGSSDYEQIMYGNFNSGPYSTSSGSEYTAIDGKVGLAGSTVQVYFDDSTDRYHIYIDGNQIFSSTSPSTYMISGTTSQPVLRLGDTTLTNGGNTPIDEDEPVPWYTRIRDLWIDNSGVLGPSSFTAIGTFRDRNLEDYDGYEYVDVYATLTGTGTSVTKGGVSLSRGTVTFT